MQLHNWISIQQGGPTPSPALQLVTNDCWSYFGDHERLDIEKKLREQPRLNPTNPKNFASGHGGQ